MTDSLTVFGTSYTGVTGIKAKGTGNGVLTYIRPQGNLAITQNTASGSSLDVSQYATATVAVPSDTVVPTFSVVYENGEFVSNTCNMTYLTLIERINTDALFDAIVIWDDGGVISSGSVAMALDLEFDPPSVVCRTVTPYGFPDFEFSYNSDGTITEPTGADAYEEPTFYENGTYYPTDMDKVFGGVTVAVPSSSPTLQAKSASPTESQQTVTPDSGYDGLSQVTVGAISTTYVGSGITQRTSADLTASGATVTVPSGYYASSASKAVTSGTEGTPTATKGTVSNHSISVTPSVTNTTGYISGGTKTGTAVTVSASELVSGTYTVGASGTHDVTEYASASVAAGSATPPTTISGSQATLTTGTNTITLQKTLSVTPRVTVGYVASGTADNVLVSLNANVTTQAAQTIHPSTSDQSIAAPRYLTGAQTIKAVTTSNLTAENIKQGVTVTIGDSDDADRIASVTGTYSGGGGGASMNTQVAQSTTRSTSTTYTEVISLTCDTAGTYDVYWTTYRSSTSNTWGSQLYLGDTAYETEVTSGWSNHVQNRHLTGVTIAANQEVSVRVRSRGSNYYGYVGTLTIVQRA